ncbi:MAG TPA: AMP-binding protein, partial [Acidimicrobiales bacterium]|nr:AMP-binding protein [Acidimicrobiales bacterium]
MKTFAGVLSSEPECLSVLFGVWLAGCRFASLPDKARGMSDTHYFDQIVDILGLAETDVIFTSDSFGSIDLPGIKHLHYSDIVPDGDLSSMQKVSGSSNPKLIQFTSGSTGSPKGVVLNLNSVAFNVTAMIEGFGFTGEDTSASWLPLSHDMGLIGTCLQPLVAMNPDLAGMEKVWVLSPEGFLRDPLGWLRVDEGRCATFTMVPNFALDIMSRRLAHASALDLRAFRHLIVSAETVRAGTLRGFDLQARRFGFDSNAFQPAYGMAEVTLGASVVKSGNHWSSLLLEREAFADGGVEILGRMQGDAGDLVLDAEEIVGLGTPFPGMAVRVTGDDPTRVGQIQIGGGSLAEALIGDRELDLDDGFYPSEDLGFIENGELYFAGRTDDWIVIAGRNIDARDLEFRAGTHPELRPGNCVAV